METKVCQQCKEDKPLDQYSKCSRFEDNKQKACKACNKLNNAKFRKKRPKYGINYMKSEKGKALHREHAKTYYNKSGGGVYIIVNQKTKEVYIGQTSQLRRREIEWRMYLNNPEVGKQYMNKQFYRDLKNQSPEDFTWSVLQEIRGKNNTEEYRKSRENYYIKLFSTLGTTYNVQLNRNE